MHSSLLRWANASLLRVSGADSTRYLHNRLTQDIKSMEQYEWRNFAALTAQGKIQLIGKILKLNADNYIISVLSGNPDAVLNSLKQFIVADRVLVERLDNGKIYYSSDLKFLENSLRSCTLEIKQNSQVYFSEDKKFLLAALYQEQLGYEIITDDLHGELQISSNSDSYLIELFRVKAKILLADVDFDNSTFLLDTGKLECVAFGAGCYVGQEVVEKTDALGKPPYRFVYFKTLQTQPNLQKDEVLTYKDGIWKKAGFITSSVVDNQEKAPTCYNIAKLKNHDFEQLKVNEMTGSLF